MTDFVHLHVHSEYSLLDGACRIKQLVLKAAELGQRAIAVTDHGCMYAAIDFYNEAKAAGIKPIIGCEVYVAPRGRFDKVHGLDNKPYHLVLLCENEEGYKNLIKLVSIGYIEGFYSKPRVDKETLRRYSGGLIALSACLAGEVARELVNGNYNGAKAAAEEYRSIFGKNNFFIEVQDHGITEQREILPFLYKLSRETGIPLVATNDAHYINKEDSDVQRVLLAIQTKTTVDEPNGMGFATNEFYLKSGDEMAKLFSAEPSALSNSVEIANRCNLDFQFGVTKLPKFEMDGVSDSREFFRRICREGLLARYGDSLPDGAMERLQYELRVIESMGYVDYFLIVWDFIRYARENGIPVGPGRGSGAGSLAAYCIGITGIDPLKYNLLFERFLNPERVSMPDFDIDFCIEGRQQVINYVVSKYGSDRVAQIITFGTMAARGAIRDVGRVMGVPYDICDKAAKLVPRDINITIDEALERSDDLRELYYSDDTVHKLIDMAKKVEGMPRNASTHAAGVVIAAAPVSEFVPLQKNDESVVTQYTMTNLERLGLLKMDFLGLRNLTVIRDSVRLIRKKLPDFDADRIPLDDKAVFEMLSRGESEGVFQFESAGMKSVLTRLSPETLEDLIAVISLYRPGPMDSIPRYIANRHDPSKITYKHPLLKDILEVTYGCIVYQEQVMQICRTLAGYSLGRADLVRRAMAKKKADVMEKERHSFIYGDKNPDGSINCVGAVANGVPESVASEIFDEMSGFASYAFNKSHAAAYAYLAYQTAYLKCHFYGEYMAALMTSVLDNTPKLIEYISECESHGLSIINPNINESYEGFVVTERGIRFALLAIKNLGAGVIRDIVAERESGGKYRSLDDFCSRMYGKNINKRAVESLIKSGAMDGFSLNRRQMLESYDRIFSGLGDLQRRNVEGQLDLFGQTDSSSGEEIAYVDEYPLDELLKMEKETLGFYISGNPMSRFEPVIKAARLPGILEITASAAEQLKGFTENDRVTFYAVISEKKLHISRNNAKMCFLTAEDSSGSIECIVFPRVYETFGRRLEKDAVTVFSGRISLKDDDVKIIVEQVYDGEEFMKLQLSRAVCIKCRSTDKQLIDSAVRLLSSSRGESGVRFYLSDIGRVVSHKGIYGVKMTENLLTKLADLAGVENVAFMD